MPGTGSSPAVFLNQQGLYPVKLTQSPPLQSFLSVSPPPPSPAGLYPLKLTQSPPPLAFLCVSPPPPSPAQELRGGTPSPWQTPPRNQQYYTWVSPMLSAPMSRPPSTPLSPPPGAQSPPPALCVDLYSDALVTPRACHPPVRKRAVVDPVWGSGAGFRPVRRRLQIDTSMAGDGYASLLHATRPGRGAGFAAGAASAFESLAAAASSGEM
jgi:hypothetical protein